MGTNRNLFSLRLCGLGIARIFKAWTNKMRFIHRRFNPPGVSYFLGKALPLLGVWAGIKIGVYFINLEKQVAWQKPWFLLDWKSCWWLPWLFLPITWWKSPVPGLPGRRKRRKVNLMICSSRLCGRASCHRGAICDCQYRPIPQR